MTASPSDAVAWSEPPKQDAPPKPPGLFRTQGYVWVWLVSVLTASAYGTTFATRSSFWDEIASIGFSSLPFHIGESIAVVLGYAGAMLFADRYSKKRLALLSQCLLLLTVVIAAAYSSLVPLTLVSVLTLVVAFGFSYAFLYALLLGWIGEIVPRRLLARGVVVLSFTSIPFGVITGIIAVLSRNEGNPLVPLFASAAILFVVAIFMTARVPGAALQQALEQTVFDHLKDGVKHAVTDRKLRTLLIFGVVLGVCGGAVATPLLWHYHYEVDLTIGKVTGLLIGRGLAASAATILLFLLISRSHSWLLLICAALLGGLTSASLVFLTSEAGLWAMAAANGASMSFVVLATRALAISSIGHGYFGRATAIILIASAFLGFVTALVSHVLAVLVSARWIIFSAGVLLLLASAWLAWEWRQIRQSPDDPDEALFDRDSMDEVFDAAPQKAGNVDSGVD